jgi:hypothetical protein
MNRKRMDALIRALVLIRFGQEIGSGGRVAATLAAFVDALLSALG